MNEERLLINYLEKYLDPTEIMTADDYLLLAQLMLELIRESSLEHGIVVRDTLIRMIEFTAKVVRDKYTTEERRAKIAEWAKHLGKSRITLYKEWLELGLQIVGTDALTDLFTERWFKIWIGAVFKLIFLVVAETHRYFCYRMLRKSAVKIEHLAYKLREFVEWEFEKDRRQATLKLLEELSSKIKEQIDIAYNNLLKERIYRNTPEVLALADKLRKLREDVFNTI